MRSLCHPPIIVRAARGRLKRFASSSSNTVPISTIHKEDNKKKEPTMFELEWGYAFDKDETVKQKTQTKKKQTVLRQLSSGFLARYNKMKETFDGMIRRRKNDNQKVFGGKEEIVNSAPYGVCTLTGLRRKPMTASYSDQPWMIKDHQMEAARRKRFAEAFQSMEEEEDDAPGIMRSLSKQLIEVVRNMPESRKEKLLESYVKMASFGNNGEELWERTNQATGKKKTGLMRSLSTEIMKHVKQMPEDRKETLLRNYCKLASFDSQGNYVLWDEEDRGFGILRTFSKEIEDRISKMSQEKKENMLKAYVKAASFGKPIMESHQEQGNQKRKVDREASLYCSHGHPVEGTLGVSFLKKNVMKQDDFPHHFIDEHGAHYQHIPTQEAMAERPSEHEYSYANPYSDAQDCEHEVALGTKLKFRGKEKRQWKMCSTRDDIQRAKNKSSMLRRNLSLARFREYMDREANKEAVHDDIPFHQMYSNHDVLNPATFGRSTTFSRRLPREKKQFVRSENLENPTYAKVIYVSKKPIEREITMWG